MMIIRKYDLPTRTFPYKISKRLNILSVPRKYSDDYNIVGLPPYTPHRVRTSALNARPGDRIIDAAWPYVRRLILVKRQYKTMFCETRRERLDKMIELSNGTCYAKMANCVVDLRPKDTRKKKAWTESDWKKHMDYIKQIAFPRKDFTAEPARKLSNAPQRPKSAPLSALLPRINRLATLPPFKMHRRLSQETWYKDPMKVSAGAKKYVISARTLELSKPRALPAGD